MATPRVVPLWLLCTQIVGLALTALLALSATVVLIASAIAWCIGGQVLGQASILLGTICALMAWLIAAAFHFKKETIVIPVADRRFFMDRVAAQLQALGYEITTQSDRQVASRPSFRSLLVGGGIEGELGAESARLVGPKVYVELLRRRLRLDNYIDRFQKDFLDHKRRQGERLLRRVQLSFEVSGEHWQDVQDKIIARLEHEGAVVHCQINILAQSEVGIRDSIVELGVQEWLRKHGIKADVHREGMRAGDSSVLHLPEVPKESVSPTN